MAPYVTTNKRRMHHVNPSIKAVQFVDGSSTELGTSVRQDQTSEKKVSEDVSGCRRQCRHLTVNCHMLQCSVFPTVCNPTLGLKATVRAVLPQQLRELLREICGYCGITAIHITVQFSSHVLQRHSGLTLNTSINTVLFV